MKISTILDHIDSGYMALPKFQRGYVWNRDQVRRLMDSLYRRHPVGSLLVWVTESEGAPHRGDSPLPPGQVKLLLDGQQRMTTMYGIIRGKPPEFFDGNAKSFTGLHFNLATEEFSFYMARKMEGDPLWVDVTRLMDTGLGPFIQELSTDPQHVPNVTDYINRLNTLHSIRDIEFHAEEVTGQEKNVEVVVDIFNRINSGGTKLSQGDLALAKICAGWPEARDEMKEILATWKDADYKFDLDWLLRNVNTVLTGEARFVAMHHVEPAEVQEGLRRAQRACDLLLNLVSDRLGLDHNRVLFGRYAFPVMAHYVDRRGGRLDDREEQDRLLYWYLQNAMWGRFSASTESTINQDLHQLENMDGGLDRLLDELRLWRGDLRVKPGHFVGWSIGARFYPVLYLLTRVGEARDWGSGVALKRDMLGRGSSLHVHHIFPKARLYKVGRRKSEVKRSGQLRLPDPGHQPRHRCQAPRGLLRGDREQVPGGVGIPVDPHGPGTVEDRELPRLPGRPPRTPSCCHQPLPGRAGARCCGRGHGGTCSPAHRRRGHGDTIRARSRARQHRQRGRAGDATGVQRPCRGPGAARGGDAVRGGRRQQRPSARDLRPGMAQRSATRAQSAGCGFDRRGARDACRRGGYGFPVLHLGG